MRVLKPLLVFLRSQAFEDLFWTEIETLSSAQRWSAGASIPLAGLACTKLGPKNRLFNGLLGVSGAIWTTSAAQNVVKMTTNWTPFDYNPPKVEPHRLTEKAAILLVFAPEDKEFRLGPLIALGLLAKLRINWRLPRALTRRVLFPLSNIWRLPMFQKLIPTFAAAFAAVAICFVSADQANADCPYGGGRGVSVSYYSGGFNNGFGGGFNNFNSFGGGGFNSFNSFGGGFGGGSFYRPSYGGGGFRSSCGRY